MSKKVKYTICNCGNPDGHTGAVWHMGQPLPANAELVDPNLLLIGGNAKMKIKEVEFEVVTFRCGCGDPDSHSHLAGEAGICPKPRKIVDHKTVAYYHTNPLKRLRWWISRRFVERQLRREGEYTPA